MDDTTRANGYKHGRPEGRDVKPADEIVRKVIEALPAEARLYPDVYAWQVTDALEAATVAPAVDREALAERLFYIDGRDDWGVANEDEREEYLERARELAIQKQVKSYGDDRCVTAYGQMFDIDDELEDRNA